MDSISKYSVYEIKEIQIIPQWHKNYFELKTLNFV